MEHIARYLKETEEIVNRIDARQVDRVISVLETIRQAGGRLFFLGVGGSAANASHAVNDFRKLCGFEAYAPTDNVAELSARVNDDGWDSTFAAWLEQSRLGAGDGVFVFSVGGGSVERNISPNLVRAVDHAKKVGAKVLGVVGRADGYAARMADACVVIPTVNAATVTPHAEEFQAVVWHLIVSHPRLRVREAKWESVK